MIIIEAENDELINLHQNGERVAEILKSHDVAVVYHVVKGITHYASTAKASRKRYTSNWSGSRSISRNPLRRMMQKRNANLRDVPYVDV